MRRSVPSLVIGSLLSLAVLLPGSASAASAGSTLFEGLNSWLSQFGSSITLGSSSTISSLFQTQTSTSLPIVRQPRPRVSAVPEPGAFLAFGAGALVIGASLRRRRR